MDDLSDAHVEFVDGNGLNWHPNNLVRVEGQPSLAQLPEHVLRATDTAGRLRFLHDIIMARMIEEAHPNAVVRPALTVVPARLDQTASEHWLAEVVGGLAPFVWRVPRTNDRDRLVVTLPPGVSRTGRPVVPHGLVGLDPHYDYALFEVEATYAREAILRSDRWWRSGWGVRWGDPDVAVAIQHGVTPEILKVGLQILMGEEPQYASGAPVSFWGCEVPQEVCRRLVAHNWNRPESGVDFPYRPVTLCLACGRAVLGRVIDGWDGNLRVEVRCCTNERGAIPVLWLRREQLRKLGKRKQPSPFQLHYSYQGIRLKVGLRDVNTFYPPEPTDGKVRYKAWDLAAVLRQIRAGEEPTIEAVSTTKKGTGRIIAFRPRQAG